MPSRLIIDATVAENLLGGRQFYTDGAADRTWTSGDRSRLPDKEKLNSFHRDSPGRVAVREDVNTIQFLFLC